ncbi:sigma-70 family RNA polymerase sigma factor [Streptomyces albus]|uniref:sigma-70 family RNA polymerase sigma factor n=1 Tax=Streptomyces albus TaxID=1888 RepID=UPI003F4D29D6
MENFSPVVHSPVTDELTTAPGAPEAGAGMPGEEWEQHRPAVFGVAYRLLGSVADAEDVTQDVWLRTARVRPDGIADPRAWLVTVAARRAYDVLRSARVRREEYVGPWLPEPLLTGPDAAEPVLADESVGTAMLLVMEELNPAERVAFVLRDVFRLSAADIGRVLDRSPAAVRQLTSRARRRIADARDRAPGEDGGTGAAAAGAGGGPSARAERERLLLAFRAACLAGDLEGLVKLLDPDAVYVVDGGGEVFAARKPITGGRRIAEVLLRVARRWRLDGLRPVEVGGEPALLCLRAGALHSVDTVLLRNGRIAAYWRQATPSKLSHVPAHI